MDIAMFTPKEFLDECRKAFDGANSFVYRIYEGRERCYTVEEFLALRAPRMVGAGWVIVCRDGYGWSVTTRGDVFGLPCPWSVPGPGEHIP